MFCMFCNLQQNPDFSNGESVFRLFLLIFESSCRTNRNGTLRKRKISENVYYRHPILTENVKKEWIFGIFPHSQIRLCSAGFSKSAVGKNRIAAAGGHYFPDAFVKTRYFLYRGLRDSGTASGFGSGPTRNSECSSRPSAINFSSGIAR